MPSLQVIVVSVPCALLLLHTTHSFFCFPHETDVWNVAAHSGVLQYYHQKVTLSFWHSSSSHHWTANCSINLLLNVRWISSFTFSFCSVHQNKEIYIWYLQQPEDCCFCNHNFCCVLHCQQTPYICVVTHTAIGFTTSYIYIYFSLHGSNHLPGFLGYVS
jgi:hypothetical protein